jgi:hypothetical protein
MRRFPLALGLLAVVVVTGCDDPDSVPVQPSRTASVLTLSAFPTTVLRSGSDVRVTARATDGQGALVEGTPVTFASTTGALNTSSATTSSSGNASVTLSASDAARVTASLSTGPSAAIELPAVAPFTVAIERPPTILVNGATFSARVTMNSSVPGPPVPTMVTIHCGFGSAVDVTTTLSHRCEFPSAGDFTVQATAHAANGWTISDSVPVTAGTPSSSNSPAVSVRAVEIGRYGGSAEWRFTATASAPMGRFEFDFGDGHSATKATDTTNLMTATEQHLYADGLGKSSTECPVDSTNPKAFNCTLRVTGRAVSGNGSASTTLAIRVEIN